MRWAVTLLLLAGLCAFGAARNALGERLPSPRPPSCATRVEVRGPDGFERLACAAEVAAQLRDAGRPASCPSVETPRDGARVTVKSGVCDVEVARMAGPALRLLRLPIDINLSSVEDLQALPGIGPALALRILAARPYRATSELGRVAGIGSKRLAALVAVTEVRGRW